MPQTRDRGVENELLRALERLRQGKSVPDSAYAAVPFLRRRYLNHHVQVPAATDRDVWAAMRDEVRRQLALRRNETGGANWTSRGEGTGSLDAGRRLPDSLRSTRDDETDALADDFEVPDIDRQAWSCLYHRYFAPMPWRVKDLGAVASPQAADAARLVRHRIRRGAGLLLNALEAPDPAAQPASTGVAFSTPALEEADDAHHLLFQVSRPSTRFVGRDAERDQLAGRLRAERVVSLVGPPGVGKTRLLVEVAGSLLEDFRDGVWLVELAALTDATEVPQAVARLLGARAGGPADETATRAIIRRLRDRSALVLLDNCEHVMEGVTPLVEALRLSCRRVHIGLTSRVVPALPGQDLVEVRPLATPPPGRTLTGESILDFAAVELFADRARRVNPSFRVTDRNAAAVGELVQRLDGLPLAIELAAAWMNVFGPREIIRRLEERFALLTRVSRSIAGNLQPLALALDWSYQLLAVTEQRVLDRLSVFRGDFCLTAAEAVSADVDMAGTAHVAERDVARFVDALVSKFLVRPLADRSGERRFLLLDSIRDYGRDHLRGAGQLADVQLRHAEWYGDWVAGLAVGLADPRTQSLALGELDTERENVRAALDACVADARGRDTGICLLTSILPFWMLRERPSDGHRILGDLLSHAGAIPSSVDGNAHLASSVMWRAADDERSAWHAREALAIYGKVADEQGMAAACQQLGPLAEERGDLDEAEGWYAASQSHFHAAGDERHAAIAGLSLGDVAYRRGDLDRAAELVAASHRLLAETDDPWAAGVSALREASLALDRGDLSAAEALGWQGLRSAQSLDDAIGVMEACALLGHVASGRGDIATARRCHVAYLPTLSAVGGRHQIGEWLEVMAALDIAEGHHERAVRLLAGSHRCRQDVHRHLKPPGMAEAVGRLRELHRRLGASCFAAEWDQGQRTGWPFLMRLAADRPSPAGSRADDRSESRAGSGASVHQDEMAIPCANLFYTIAVDCRRGVVWTGGPAGLVRFDIDSGAWRRYTMADGLPGNSVGGVYLDAEPGDVWVGTTGGLCVLHTDGRWTYFDPASMPTTTDPRPAIGSNPVAGPPWVVLGPGRIGRPEADGSWWWRDLPSPLDSSGTSMAPFIHPLTGDLWIGTQHGAVQLRPNGTWSEVVWPGRIVTSFGFDTKRRRVYLSASGRLTGLRCVDEGFTELQAPHRNRDGLANRHVYGLAYDPASDWLWLCSDRGAQILSPDGEWLDSRPADGLPHPAVYLARTDDATGDMWFVTADGLGRRAPDGAWTVYRTEPQEPPAALRSAARDIVWQHYARRKWLAVGAGRWLWTLGFRFGQPGQLFAWELELGHGGVPDEVLAELLGR